jgi:predicted cupin superfamily sugar epimerase
MGIRRLWIIGIRRLQEGGGGGWRNSEWGIYFICNKEEEWSHIVRRNVTKIWRVQALDRRFRNIRISGCTSEK